MVDPETFKRNIKDIVAQEYTLEFLGINFDKIVSLLSEVNAEKMTNYYHNFSLSSFIVLSIFSFAVSGIE